MGKFAIYNIPLKSLPEGSTPYEFQLDDQFFQKIDEGDIRYGSVKVDLIVKRIRDTFEFTFNIEGTIRIACDRCLDLMEQAVCVHEKLYVKFGSEYSEESDNIVIIPESDGEVNIAWFLYEFVALAIPLKHTHPAGQCNKAVMSQLRKHSTRRASNEDDFEDEESADEMFASDDESESSTSEETDPRWDELKKIVDNN